MELKPVRVLHRLNGGKTMKVKCPKCQAVIKADQSKIPEKGAYGRCPKCQERFLIRREDGFHESPPKVDGMVCPHCQQEINLGDVQCPKCGVVYEKYSHGDDSSKREEKRQNVKSEQKAEKPKTKLIITVFAAIVFAAIVLLVIVISIPEFTNKQLTIEEFTKALQSNGMHLGEKTDKWHGLLRATRGYGIDVNGDSIEIYQFDTTIKSGKKAIEKWKEEGYMGQPVVVNKI